ncbi:hypothetical protein EGJ57_05385 [Brucella anthropi]|nr:hypothetical protein CQ057_04800 [Ochrobactrum sp. MYb49]RRY22194.1 hypothetical protein EGJ57_05385 [Brucella anthropi]
MYECLHLPFALELMQAFTDEISMAQYVGSISVLRRKPHIIALRKLSLLLFIGALLSACATYHSDRQIDDTLGPPGPIAKVPG